jgi:hypothetical protein
MRDHPNPFEALDLDPTLDIADLTEALRELAEALPPHERGRVQGLWQQLTLRREDRVEAALLARPRGVAVKEVGALARRLGPPPQVDPLAREALQSQVPLLEVLPWPRHDGGADARALPPTLLTSLTDDPFWSP